MENFDYFIYYVQEDILVCYSFEDNSLREDTIYGFEYCASNLSTNPYFWDFDWDHCDYCRHRVLYSNYTLEEFKENIVDNDRFISFDYQTKYTILDVLNALEIE